MCLLHLSSHQLCGYTHFNGINATKLLQIDIFHFMLFFCYFSFYVFSTPCIKKVYKNLTGTPYLKPWFFLTFVSREDKFKFINISALWWWLHCYQRKMTFADNEGQWQWLRQHHRAMRKPETKPVKQKMRKSKKKAIVTQLGLFLLQIEHLVWQLLEIWEQLLNFSDSSKLLRC